MRGPVLLWSLLSTLMIADGASDVCGCVEFPAFPSRPSTLQTFSPLPDFQSCLAICAEHSAHLFTHLAEREWCVCGEEGDLITCEEEEGPTLEVFCINNHLNSQASHPGVQPADYPDYSHTIQISDEMMTYAELMARNATLRQLTTADLTAAEQAALELTAAEFAAAELAAVDSLLPGEQLEREAVELEGEQQKQHLHNSSREQDSSSEQEWEEELGKVGKDSKTLALILGIVSVICLMVGVFSVFMKHKMKMRKEMRRKEMAEILKY